MIFFTNCKINIGLDILERRADGYHTIETLMYPIQGLCDALEIIPAPEPGIIFSSSGLAVDCPDDKNLCVRAYRLMQQRYAIGGVRMHLHKVIPSGAGLGGGSANAAYTIKGLCALFELTISPEEQEALAAQLGSDTAFFIRNQPAIASGRGEILTPADISLRGYRLVILKPDFGVSTAEAYAGVIPHKPSETLVKRLRSPVETWHERIENDFEPGIFTRHPRIAELKALMYNRGAVYASMSGSGSAVFGLFRGGEIFCFNLNRTFEYQEDIL